jgi:hypothetical protein
METNMRNPLSRVLLAAAFLVFVAPSPLWAKGQSLKQTLAFIGAQFSAQGKVTYSIKMHDSGDGSDWGQTMSGEASNVTYDTANCTLSYHWQTTSDGETKQAMDVTWYFANGKKVSVVNREQELRSQAINDGHSTWTAIVTPSLWVVTVNFTDTAGVINFTDQGTADRVSHAIDHAMDLCGAPKEDF